MSFAILIVAWAIINVSLGAVCAVLARRWGRDPLAWLFLGLAVGPIALLALLATRWNDLQRESPVIAGPGARDAKATGPTVIVAVDGSEHSDRAVQRVIDDFGLDVGEVLVVGVLHLERADALKSGSGSLRRRDLEEEIERRLGAASEKLRAAGLASRPVVRFGDPADEIIAEAKDSSAGTVVMGRRGMGGPKKALLGSVSEKVSKDAPCEVTLVD